MEIDRFRQLPILGILRGVKQEMIDPLVETLVSCGLPAMEITMNTHGAMQLIQRAVSAAKGKLTVGAGTVLTKDDLLQALDSGATFIVSPTLVPEVVQYCVEQHIPVFPGACTPQEIYSAWQAQATMVKVFPSKFFGPGYFKEIKGPFADVELLACGGVTAGNIGEFFSSGASAVAFGASIFKPEWLEAGEFYRIGENIQALVREYEAFRDNQ